MYANALLLQPNVDQLCLPDLVGFSNSLPISWSHVAASYDATAATANSLQCSEIAAWVVCSSVCKCVFKVSNRDFSKTPTQKFTCSLGLA